MPKDTRSFFERLTGSVKIQDDSSPGEEVVDIQNQAPVLQETVELEPRPQAAVPVRRKAESAARKTASAQPSPALPADAQEFNISQAGQAASPDESEIEGQLTVDIYDDGDNIVIQSTVAGVKPEDLDVTMANDMVTIKGRRRKTEEVEEKNYYYRELYWGAFSRSVILPEEIEVEKSEASLKNGLLTIKLPKKNKNVMQKIKVKME